jgi:hypothetical protein
MFANNFDTTGGSHQQWLVVSAKSFPVFCLQAACGSGHKRNGNKCFEVIWSVQGRRIPFTLWQFQKSSRAFYYIPGCIKNQL